MRKLFQIKDADTVAVALCDLKAGYSENGVTLKQDVPFGHKVLLKDTPAGQDIIKYGCPIGCAKADLFAGEYVHSHNMRTGLGDSPVSYFYLGRSEERRVG